MQRNQILVLQVYMVKPTDRVLSVWQYIWMEVFSIMSCPGTKI